MSYTILSNVSTGDLATAALQNALIADLAVFATSFDTATGRISGEILAFREEIVAVAFSATPTFNLASGNNFKLGDLTANVTAITVSGWTASKCQTAVIALKQDGTGGRTVALPAGWKWTGGTAPVMPTTAAKSMLVVLFTYDGGTTIFASLFVTNA